MYDKSPLNYTGNKYKLLSQLFSIFPKDIETFYDIFTGGADVVANIRSSARIALDYNPYLIDIFKTLQSMEINDIINYIENTIDKFLLTKKDTDAYLHFRNYYNTSEKCPLDLFILVCYSFSNMMRFNSDGEFNKYFGKRYFNPNQKKNLIKFHANIKEVNFRCNDFRVLKDEQFKPNDFVYCDPPYLITSADYNANARTAYSGWNEKDDVDLFELLDSLNEKKIRFALSNVFYSRGKSNEPLIEWSKKYNAIPINSDYTNVIYNLKNKNLPAVEVVIINY